MFVYRQLSKFDGSVRSLALVSRKPHSHSNQHTDSEVKLVTTTNSRYRCDGLAEVYVKCKSKGYSRSFSSMSKVIRKELKVPYKSKRTHYTKHTEVRGSYPGDKVQIDIKYVPNACIAFNSHGKRYGMSTLK